MPQIAEFVFRLSEEYLISSDGNRNHVLRAALRSTVPGPFCIAMGKLGLRKLHRKTMTGLRHYVEQVQAKDAASLVSALNIKQV